MHETSDESIQRFFVYGTLKRGQCRERCWPAIPSSVVPAWTSGHLYGRRDYPAMTHGNDRVLGECWTFREEEILSVQQTLDKIEGTHGNSPTDLYHRHAIAVDLIEGAEQQIAYAYFYVSNPAIDGFERLLAGPDSFVSWPAASRNSC